MTASTVPPAVVTLPASRRVVALRLVPRAELEQAGCDLIRLWLYTQRWRTWFERVLRQTLLPYRENMLHPRGHQFTRAEARAMEQALTTITRLSLVRPVVVDRRQDVVSEDQVYSGAIPWRDKAYVVERHWVLLQPLPEFVCRYWGDDEPGDDESDEGEPDDKPDQPQRGRRRRG